MPGFTISITPNDGDANSTFTVVLVSQENPINGQDFNIELECVTNNGTLSNSVVFLPRGHTANALCQAHNVISQNNTNLTIRGTETGAAPYETDTATIRLGDFGMAISPASGNGNQDFDVVVTSINGFQGTVQLDCTTGNGTLASLGVFVPSNGQGQTTCRSHSVIGNPQQMTVQGTFNGLNHSVDATVTPGDFSIDLSPATGPVAMPFTVSVNSVNNFEGTVQLGYNNATGPANVFVPAGGTGTAPCTAQQANPLTATGTYLTLSHQATATAT